MAKELKNSGNNREGNPRIPPAGDNCRWPPLALVSPLWATSSHEPEGLPSCPTSSERSSGDLIFFSPHSDLIHYRASATTFLGVTPSLKSSPTYYLARNLYLASGCLQAMAAQTTGLLLLSIPFSFSSFSTEALIMAHTLPMVED